MTAHANKKGAWEAWRLRRLFRREANLYAVPRSEFLFVLGTCVGKSTQERGMLSRGRLRGGFFCTKTAP
jgi:hypothetical protein